MRQLGALWPEPLLSSRQILKATRLTVLSIQLPKGSLPLKSSAQKRDRKTRGTRHRGQPREMGNKDHWDQNEATTQAKDPLTMWCSTHLEIKSWGNISNTHILMLRLYCKPTKSQSQGKEP